MNYKALFLDVDDTLLGNDKIISKANLEAIGKAMDKGVFVTIATGRGYLGACPVWKEMNILGPILVYGGATIVDTTDDTILFNSEINPELILEALEVARELGLHAQIYQGDTVIFEKESEFAKRYTDFLRLPVLIDPKLREKKWQKVPKVLIFAPPEVEASMMSRIKQIFENRLEVAASKPGFIELNCFGVNKGTSMLRLCEMLKIDPAEVIAVGDNTLDERMIQLAGLGVCVENGQEAVKAMADVIAPACDKDAVKWVIEKYLL